MVSLLFNAHTPPICKYLNIITFDNICNYFVCTFTFKVAQRIHPQIFESIFVQNKNIHNYGTRLAQLYCTHIDKTNVIRNSLRCAGVII